MAEQYSSFKNLKENQSNGEKGQPFPQQSRMTGYSEAQLQSISKQFQIYGEILRAEACKIGHINETYIATYGQGGIPVRYVHQKINKNVFKKPDEVMGNMMRVTNHIREHLEKESESEVTRKVITIIPTRDGQPFYRDPNGDFWRTFLFVENVKSYEAVESPGQAVEAGRGFGKFQKCLTGLEGDRLFETIPYFHHSRKRFEAFKRALEEDRYNRASQAKKEIDFAIKNEPIVDVLLNAFEAGEIPERITHNDTKFNNVLLDVNSGKAMCVVDLDTVMPGLALYDFGDMVRTTTSPTLEDEKDLSRVNMRMEMFEGLAKGYLGETGKVMTPGEIKYVAFSGKLMPLTIGLRFLTDFLSGDFYFRVHRPGHNLDRCRTQFKLVQSVIEQEDAMESVVQSIMKQLD